LLISWSLKLKYNVIWILSYLRNSTLNKIYIGPLFPIRSITHNLTKLICLKKFFCIYWLYYFYNILKQFNLLYFIEIYNYFSVKENYKIFFFFFCKISKNILKFLEIEDNFFIFLILKIEYVNYNILIILDLI